MLAQTTQQPVQPSTKQPSVTQAKTLGTQSSSGASSQQARSQAEYENQLTAEQMRRLRYALIAGQVVLGTIWAVGLFVGGVALWQQVHPVAGLAMIAGGEFVLMWMVADALFPRRRRSLTDFLEVVAGVTFVLALLAAGVLLLQHALAG